MWRLIALTRDVKKFRIRRNSKARLDLMFAVNLLTTLMGNLRLSKMNGRTFINLICTQMLQKKLDIGLWLVQSGSIDPVNT